MPARLHAAEDNVVNLADVRARYRPTLPVSLDMDWDAIHAEDEPRSMGRTIWVAVIISTALWAVIAGAVWFV